ncbi:RHS repeat-associated core domain-containing protein [uncultured Gimesia sp.]|mgnify:CR=1 FL=1|uniref:RHS repeat-associated core domain-containing protein n=1 Tax=uncultured Gimesia sp. TaxID=1678688 RepID=UPI00262F12CA|nr:RHS repeat-associated core domain-containing protein [uncultured Gimesia sp.]
MTVTNYLWDEDSYLEEYDEVGATTAAYTNEPTEFGSVISQHRNSDTSFYHYDTQGSTQQMTDQSENVTDTFSYDSWGNEVARTGTAENPFRYIGEFGYYHDDETDSYYIRARVYKPMIGRWLSVDPLGFIASTNLYAYVQGSSVNYIDPSGLVEVAFDPKDAHSHPWTIFTKPRGDDWLGYTETVREKISCKCQECFCHEFEVKCSVDLAYKIYIKRNNRTTVITHFIPVVVYNHEQRHVENMRNFVNNILVPILETYERPCLTSIDEKECQDLADRGTRQGQRLYARYDLEETRHESDFWKNTPLWKWYNFPVLGHMPPPISREN